MNQLVERAAEEIAANIDRRRVLRRIATGTFYAIAGTALGGGLDIWKAAIAQAAVNLECAGSGNTGLGCPNTTTSGFPCGPSRCCNHIRSGMSSNCDCQSSSTSATCKNDGVYCFGKDERAWTSSSLSPGCWTCVGPCYKCGTTTCKDHTTCCDCKTSHTRCNDPSINGGHGRCIAWVTSRTGC